VRLESLRIAAGAAMGIADAAERVIPKPVLIAPAQRGGALMVRYFMPHQCHLSLAITGSVAIATACCTPGTLAAEAAGPITLPTRLAFEHPSGRLEVALERRPGLDYPVASVIRTARRLFEGTVFAKPPVRAASRAA
jgi:2-methylaconitate cis-trans-isomerase PrpF